MSDASYAENIARKQRLAAKFNIELLIYLPAELRNVSELVKSLKVTTGSQTTQNEWHQVAVLPIPTHTPSIYIDITDTSIRY